MEPYFKNVKQAWTGIYLLSSIITHIIDKGSSSSFSDVLDPFFE